VGRVTARHSVAADTLNRLASHQPRRMLTRRAKKRIHSIEKRGRRHPKKRPLP
jgi:hypothetical protein